MTTSSSPDSGTGGSHGAAAQHASAHSVAADIAQIHHIDSQIRLWRIGMVLAVLAIFAISAFSIVKTVKTLVSGKGPEQFAKALTKQAEASLLPSVKKMGEKAWQDSRETVTREVRQLIDTQGPVLVAQAAQELESLVDTVPQTAMAAFNTQLATTLKKHLGDISKLESAPSGDPGRLAFALTDELFLAATNRTSAILSTLFQPHLEEMATMTEYLNAIYAKERSTLDSREHQFTLSIALKLVERVNAQLQEAEEALRAQKEIQNIPSTPVKPKNKEKAKPSTNATETKAAPKN